MTADPLEMALTSPAGPPLLAEARELENDPVDIRGALHQILESGIEGRATQCLVIKSVAHVALIAATPPVVTTEVLVRICFAAGHSSHGSHCRGLISARRIPPRSPARCEKAADAVFRNFMVTDFFARGKAAYTVIAARRLPFHGNCAGVPPLEGGMVIGNWPDRKVLCWAPFALRSRRGIASPETQSPFGRRTRRGT